MKNLLILLSLIVTVYSCETRECCVLPEKNFTFEEAASGCGNFYVYKELPEEYLHLYVRADRDALNLDLTEKEFDVSNEDITVEMLQFDGAIGQYACDDVANDQGEIISTWSAISGKVSMQITRDSISVNPWEMTYEVTVKLKEIQLENEQEERVTISDTNFKEVYVGWLPG